MNMQKMNTLTARQGRGIRQAGITLIEALLVLAIAAALAVAGYQVYKSGSEDVKAQANASGAVELVIGIQRLFSQSADYAGVTTAAIATSGVAPKSFKTTATTITNGWGGAVTVAPGTGYAATPVTNFATTIAGVPSVACVELVTTLANSATELSVLPAGGTLTAATHKVLATGGTLDAVKLGGLCGTAATASVIVML